MQENHRIHCTHTRKVIMNKSWIINKLDYLPIVIAVVVVAFGVFTLLDDQPEDETLLVVDPEFDEFMSQFIQNSNHTFTDQEIKMVKNYMIHEYNKEQRMQKSLLEISPDAVTITVKPQIFNPNN